MPRPGQRWLERAPRFGLCQAGCRRHPRFSDVWEVTDLDSSVLS